MNKLLFIAVLTISGTFITNAQDQGEFEFGGGFGLNISNVSTADGQDSTSSLISFNAGVSGEYYFSESWGAKIKLIYDSKDGQMASLIMKTLEKILILILNLPMLHYL